MKNNFRKIVILMLIITMIPSNAFVALGYNHGRAYDNVLAVVDAFGVSTDISLLLDIPIFIAEVESGDRTAREAATSKRQQNNCVVKRLCCFF